MSQLPGAPSVGWSRNPVPFASSTRTQSCLATAALVWGPLGWRGARMRAWRGFSARRCGGLGGGEAPCFQGISNLGPRPWSQGQPRWEQGYLRRGLRSVCFQGACPA